MTEKVRIRLNGDKVRYAGGVVGRYGVEQFSGEKTYVTWKNLFRIQNSYSITDELFEMFSPNVDSFYVVDKDTNEVYKFETKTYRRGRKVWANNQMQYAPDKSENVGHWDSADGLLKYT